MSEQNSKVLINVLKQTNGAVNDDIFGDQASLINRIQTKSYKGALDGLVDSLTGLRYHENHKIRAPRTTGSSFTGRTVRTDSVEPDKTREVEVFAKFSESTKIIEPGFE